MSVFVSSGERIMLQTANARNEIKWKLLVVTLISGNLEVRGREAIVAYCVYLAEEVIGGLYRVGWTYGEGCQ